MCIRSTGSGSRWWPLQELRASILSPHQIPAEESNPGVRKKDEERGGEEERGTGVYRELGRGKEQECTGEEEVIILWYPG